MSSFGNLAGRRIDRKSKAVGAVFGLTRSKYQSGDLVAPEGLRALKKIPVLRSLDEAPRRTAEVSVYFDTDDHKLRKKGLILRVRRVGNRYVQTIKANGHLAPFEQWENRDRRQ